MTQFKKGDKVVIKECATPEFGALNYQLPDFRALWSATVITSGPKETHVNARMNGHFVGRQKLFTDRLTAQLD